MTDTITLTGLVATIPNHLITGAGLPVTSFRLASTQRRFDRALNSWVDGETNWYTVTAFRQLAMNISSSVNKGERVVITGRLRIKNWSAGDKVGTNIEVDAEAIGHDLSWGTAKFVRSISGAAAVAPARTEDDPGVVAIAGAAESSSDGSSTGWATTPLGETDDGGAAVLVDDAMASASTPF